MIFTSRRTAGDEDQYGLMAERMEELAASRRGYLGIESARDPHDRFGITVSYWASETDAKAWKQVAEHLEAQRRGRASWYEGYEVRIATVTRAYGHVTTEERGLP
ncbi:MAG: antibiotic biosynthesis monooxygenase [Actinomycetota bacterium]|nr:antibiotic biosynthesis monooxygenase [Actinomycetota bacterium]